MHKIKEGLGILITVTLGVSLAIMVTWWGIAIFANIFQFLWSWV